jgi:hypothetical protein
VIRFLTIALCALALWNMEAHAASNERITKEKACHQVAVWSVDIFNLIKQNPKVYLNGMLADDEVAFDFIRQWIKDGKPRDELYEYTFNRCNGEEV